MERPVQLPVEIDIKGRNDAGHRPRHGPCVHIQALAYLFSIG